jgi:hypothetical protein
MPGLALRYDWLANGTCRVLAPWAWGDQKARPAGKVPGLCSDVRASLVALPSSSLKPAHYIRLRGLQGWCVDTTTTGRSVSDGTARILTHRRSCPGGRHLRGGIILKAQLTQHTHFGGAARV